MNNLDFIIIGAQKSGTTFLQRLLKKHPEIEMPSSEIPYFQYPDYFQIKDLDKEIANLFSTTKIKGIKRPNYIGLEESPMLIENYGNGEIKLICVLRNPVDRFISAFFHNVRYSFISPFFINNKIKKIINNQNENILHKNLIEFGMYEKYLKKYTKTIANRNLLILDYNSLINNTQVTVDRICYFLNINTFTIDKNLLNKKINEGSKSKSYLIYQFLQSKITYKFDYQHMRFFHRNNISFLRLLLLRIINQAYKFFKKAFNEKKLTISKKNLENLNNYYIQDQNELKKFLRSYDF